MRLLFSSTANDGHFTPLVGLARAAVAAGHQVRMAAPASFAAAVARAGFEHVAFDDSPPERVGPIMAALPSMSFEDANTTVVREIFGRIGSQAALPALAAAIADWQPHLVVREPAELGALVAAEAAGVPHLQVAIGMTEMSREFAELTADPLDELSGGTRGGSGSLRRALATEPVFSSVPDELDRAGDQDYQDVVACRYRDPGPGRAAATAADAPGLPVWGDPDAPLVYVTFGSVTGALPPFRGLFRQALDALADLPARVFLTVGRSVDPRAVGALPANARVESWWPQDAVLADAALLLGHGGYGTTMGAVTAAVPQVVAPIFTSDQVVNARHIAAVGAGRSAEPGPDVVIRGCAEVPTVLGDPGYAAAASRIAAAVAALPPVGDAVTALERLARRPA